MRLWFCSFLLSRNRESPKVTRNEGTPLLSREDREDDTTHGTEEARSYVYVTWCVADGNSKQAIGGRLIKLNDLE